MTPSRILELERAQNSTARKVLEAVPLETSWSSQMIAGELARMGKRMDFSTLEGCLNSLKRDGLVKEPTTGWFIRVSAKPRLVSSTEPPPQESVMATSTPTPTPFDDLTKLAQDLLEMSDRTDAICKALRAKVAEMESQHEKLKQLQQLLKGLT